MHIALDPQVVTEFEETERNGIKGWVWDSTNEDHQASMVDLMLEGYDVEVLDVVVDYDKAKGVRNFTISFASDLDCVTLSFPDGVMHKYFFFDEEGLDDTRWLQFDDPHPEMIQYRKEPSKSIFADMPPGSSREG